MFPRLRRGGRPFSTTTTLAVIFITVLAGTACGQSHIRFISNCGQVLDARGEARPEILYTAAGPGMRAYISRTGISLVLYRLERESAGGRQTFADGLRILPHLNSQIDQLGDPERMKVVGHRVDLHFVGALPRGESNAGGPDTGQLNIYRGRGVGLLGMSRYRSVHLYNVWDGIDVVVRGDGSALKYEFVVRPGADPRQIRLRYIGAETVDLDSAGGIRVTSSVGSVFESPPVSYQVSDSERSLAPHDTIASGFVLDDGEVRFSLDEYDRTKSLVIDPTLVWSTYYGGTSYDYSYGWGYGWGWGGMGQGMAVDAAGNTYVSGGTYSADFPVTPGAFQGTLQGMMDAYIVSTTSDGQLRWATLIGGGSYDYCSGLDIGEGGVLMVGGSTGSTDFPVTPGAFQGSLSTNYDAFLMRLDTTGQRVWGTYVGGNGVDYGGPLAIDRFGCVAIAGTTTSTNLSVTPGALQGALAGSYDAFVGRFDTSGARRWMTYIGGTVQDYTGGIDVDSAGRIISSITSNSPNLPTSAGSYQSTWAPLGADNLQGALFLLDSNGTRIWATYFGGAGYDWLNNCSFDRNGYIYATGGTYSQDLPTTARSIQQSLAGVSSYDAFIARFATAGALSWCTYYGGIGWEWGSASSVAPNGRLYATGITTSTDLIRSPSPYQSTQQGVYDAYFIEVDSGGRLIWDSYIGGSAADYGTGIVGDGSGSIYISGFTNSTDFPVRNAIQPSLSVASGVPSQYWDAFMMRFCNTLYPVVNVDGPASFCDGDSVVIEGPGGYDRYRWSPTNDTTRTILVRRPGRYSVFVQDVAGCSGASDTATIVVHPLPRPTIQIVGDLTFCQGDSVILRIHYPAAQSYRWSTGSTDDSIVVRSAGTYTVQVVDSNGCIALAPAQIVSVRPRPAPARITPNGPVFVCTDSTTVLRIDSSYFRVVWNDGQSTHAIRVGPGAYWATVYNSVNCSNRSDTILVREHPRSSVSITPRGPILMCKGDSVRLDGGTGFARYAWSTGDTSRFTWAKGEGTYTLSVVDTNGCHAVAQGVRITEYAAAAPSIVVLGQRRLCQGDSVQLDGGIGLYQRYRWNTGDTTARIWVRSGGRYTVTVTTFDGCHGGSASEDIVVVQRPPVDIAGPIEICTGTEGIYSVDPQPGMRYAWSLTGDGSFRGSANGPSATIAWGSAGTGTVTLTITNVNTGCDSTVTLAIVVGTTLLPRISAARLNVCPGDSVLLDAGDGYVDYTWSTGEKSRTIWGKGGVVYTVEVRNAQGCRGTSNAITIQEAPSPLPIITASGPLTLCTGDSVVLDAGAGYSSYLWSDGATGRYLTARDSGTYSVEVLDSNGCSGLSAGVDIVVQPTPRPDVAGPSEVCRNSIATYSSALNVGSTYVWAVTGGVVQSGQGTEQIAVQWGGASGGTVEVDEQTTGGCSGRSTPLLVTVGTQLRPVVTPSGITGFCPGDSVVLDGGGGYTSYLWSTGDTTRRLAVRLAGTYNVTVEDAGGCSGTSSDVVVNAWSEPVPVVRALGPTTIPSGDSVIIEVADIYPEYRWSNGRRTRQIVVRNTGIYNVEVTDSNGCRGVSEEIAVTVLAPEKDTADIRLTLGRMSAPPGNLIRYPIRLSSVNLATSGIIRITGDLRFNRTLLAPLAGTPFGVIDQTDRIVPIEFDVGSISTGASVLHIEFIAALGNADRTPLVLENVTTMGGEARVTVDTGQFVLADLCMDGGTRLVNTDGAFGIKSVRPNPARHQVTIEYEVLEHGPTRITIADLTGSIRIVVVDRDMSPGRYELAFDADTLPSGSYTIVLSSPTQQAVQPLRLVR